MQNKFEHDSNSYLTRKVFIIATFKAVGSSYVTNRKNKNKKIEFMISHGNMSTIRAQLYMDHFESSSFQEPNADTKSVWDGWLRFQMDEDHAYVKSSG